MAKATVGKHNGYPAIMIDDVPYPPMTATIRTHVFNEKELCFDKAYFSALGKAGIKIFFVMCDTEWTRPGAMEQLDDEMTKLLDAVPDAYVFLRIGLHPPLWWLEENQNEIVLFSDGSHRPHVLRNETFTTKLPGMYSLCSEKWRQDAGKALEETCLTLDKCWFADRIIGYFLAGGNTSEWHYGLEGQPGYWDLSKAFKTYYSSYLGEKYGTDEKLRAAWRMENATIDDPWIPDEEARAFIYQIEHEIFNPAERVFPTSEAPPAPRKDSTIGTFLNVEKYYAVFDYLRAWHCGTADSIIYFGDIIKRIAKDKLVGGFYGSMDSTIVNGGNAACTLRVLESGKVDLLAAPGVYQNRQPGGYTGQREVTDSFRLHNCIYFVEDDTRTHAENTYFRNFAETFCIEDTINVLKRDFGRNLSEDLQSWWFDQLIGGGRYKYPEVYELFGKQQQLAHLAYSMGRTKKNEIALIYDEESTTLSSYQTSYETIVMLRNLELSRIGASADLYFHNDMKNPEMPSYKLYIFCNVFSLTDEEREAIHKKLRKDHAVAVWIYGSGVINPEAENRFAAENITKLTGIKMEMLDDMCTPKFRFNGEDHPAFRALDRKQIYGWNYRLMQLSVVNGVANRGHVIYPVFYSVDEDAVNTAHLLENGLPAVSVKELDGFTSVFYGAKLISSTIIRELAKFAGCHIFCDSDDVIYANRNFITIHASTTGEKKLRFPQKCTPVEVYEEKTYGTDVGSISFQMQLGETKTFWLNVE